MMTLSKWEGDLKPDELVVINTDQFVWAQPFAAAGKDYAQVIMSTGHRFVVSMSVLDLYKRLEADV